MKPHVLILEDDFLLAAHLEDVVQDDLQGNPIGVFTVAEALEIVPDEISLAFLDIEVRDGQSYPVARKLIRNDIPCIIVSGNDDPRRFEGYTLLVKTGGDRSFG